MDAIRCFAVTEQALKLMTQFEPRASNQIPPAWFSWALCGPDSVSLSRFTVASTSERNEFQVWLTRSRAHNLAPWYICTATDDVDVDYLAQVNGGAPAPMLVVADPCNADELQAIVADVAPPDECALSVAAATLTMKLDLNFDFSRHTAQFWRTYGQGLARWLHEHRSDDALFEANGPDFRVWRRDVPLSPSDFTEWPTSLTSAQIGDSPAWPLSSLPFCGVEITDGAIKTFGLIAAASDGEWPFAPWAKAQLQDMVRAAVRRPSVDFGIGTQMRRIVLAFSMPASTGDALRRFSGNLSAEQSAQAWTPHVFKPSDDVGTSRNHVSQLTVKTRLTKDGLELRYYGIKWRSGQLLEVDLKDPLADREQHLEFAGQAEYWKFPIGDIRAWRVDRMQIVQLLDDS